MIIRKKNISLRCAFAIAAVILSQVLCAQPNNTRAFMEEGIGCERYVFPPGKFPAVRWMNEMRVESEVGPFTLTATYYNCTFERVARAAAPGRYGAVIEGRTPSGFLVKRYVTLFCSAVEFDDYSRNVPVKMQNLREYGIAQKKWDRYDTQAERFSFGSLKYFPQRDADAAVFLAGLNEMDTAAAANDDTPRIRDRQWWITLKRTLDGDTAVAALRAPTPAGTSSPALAETTAVAPSGYERERIDALRTVCRDWAEHGGVPHVVLIVHKGRIIFHEAFGNDEEGTPLSTASPMWMASITKLLTGVLMMQFVDQGLVDLDAPVGRYLPELRGGGNDRLTVRHLFTHTTGLSFAGEWASDWNPALENQAAQVLPTAEVGGAFSYHRVGYALAGRIMERITGCAAPYLFREYVFTPLGMKTAYADNTYGGLYCTVRDLARFGQMLLHKGTANGVRLFSEQTFETMLPRPLPVGGRKWGIGTSAYDGHGLSAAAFGHGAASGTVLRIDPDNDLIIISARNTPGARHSEYESAFVERCTALVRGH